MNKKPESKLKEPYKSSLAEQVIDARKALASMTPEKRETIRIEGTVYHKIINEIDYL